MSSQASQYPQWDSKDRGHGRQHITTSSGAPVDSNQNSLTQGPKGPIVIGDFHLFDKLAHFHRERIPERVVHAKGAGAHGYFEVTHDITSYCKAKMFGTVGKRTPCFVRFSTVGGEKGSADTARDPRGFAIKFYTEEGNLDLVCNNTPVFFVRDPLKFSDFIHTQKKHPQTNLPDAEMFWDFLSLVPESVHQVTILFSNRGTPYGYRHMNGYGSHSFKLVNQKGDVQYCKFHFKTNQGIKNFTGEEAKRMSSEDLDFATRDLFTSINNKDFPSWTLYIQVMTLKAAEQYRWNVLDVTKVWPHRDFPLIPVGQLVLNRNPENYFADTEQAAFSPAHLVPGVEPSEDKMLQGRLFSYSDTHRHRLGGGNVEQIPINAPRNCPMGNYNHRDGYFAIAGNWGATPNYEPNSVKGTFVEDPEFSQSKTVKSGLLGRYDIPLTDDDFVQPGNLYRNVMTETDRQHLVSNICNHLKNAKTEIQNRMVQVFGKCDADYGQRVEKGLSIHRPSSRTSKL